MSIYFDCECQYQLMKFVIPQWLLLLQIQLQDLRSEMRLWTYKLVSLLQISVWITLAVSVIIYGQVDSLLEMASTDFNSSLVIFCLGFSLTSKVGIFTSFPIKKKTSTYRTFVYFLLTLNDSLFASIDTIVVIYIFTKSYDLTLKIVSSGTWAMSFGLKLLCELQQASHCLINTDPCRRLPNTPKLLLQFVLRNSLLALLCLPDIPYCRILVSIISCLCILTECGYLNGLPYFSRTATSLNIILFSLTCSLMFILIVQEISLLFLRNLPILYTITTLFWMQFSFNYYSTKKSKLLIKKLDHLDNHSQAVNKMHHLRETFFEEGNGNKEFVDSLIKDHMVLCTSVDCVCRDKEVVLVDVMIDPKMKTLRTASSNLKYRRNLYLKHFILAECQIIAQYFYRKIDVTILKLSALADIGLYPRVIHESTVVENAFSHDLSFQSHYEIKYLKMVTCRALNNIIASPQHLNIEIFKEYETLFGRLDQTIEQLVDNKLQLWKYMLQGCVMYEELNQLLERQQNLIDLINKYYSTAKENNFKSKGMFSLMTHYARNIVENTELHRQISKIFLLEKCSGDLNFLVKVNEQFVDMNEFLGCENCSVLRVSTSCDTIGRIQWYSRNFLKMFRYDDSVTLIGENMNIIVPQAFRKQHQNVMKKWYNSPDPTILNRFRNLCSESADGTIHQIGVYIRIVALTEGIELYCLLSKTDSAQHILLNENMEVINQPKCIEQEMKSSSFSNNIKLNLLLLSTIDVEQFDFKKQIVIELKISENYAELFEKYTNALKSSSTTQEMRKSIRLYYNTLIQQEIQHYKITIRGTTNRFMYVFQSYTSIKVTHKIQKCRRNSVKSTNLQRLFPSASLQQSNSQQSITFINMKASAKTRKQTIQQKQQHSSQSSLMSQGPLTPTKILFLDHTLLKRMNFFLIISLAIMLCIFGLRISYSITYLKNYTDIMNADSSVSDLMQLCEVTYDYAIILKESVLGRDSTDGDAIDQEYIRRIVLDILDILLGLTYRDGLAQAPTTVQKSVLQSFSYLQKKTEMTVLGQPKTVSNALFFRMWFSSVHDVVQQIPKCTNNTPTAVLQSSIKFLVDNYPAVVTLNHDLISVYQEKGEANMESLSVLNWIFMPIVLMSSLMFVIQIVRFKVLDEKKLKELLKLFGTIDQEQIKYYLSHYLEIKNKAPMLTTKKTIPFIANRKVNYVSKQTHKPMLRYVCLFLMLFVWQLICCLETQNYIPKAITELTQMNNIMDSENYLIEDMIAVNEIKFNVRTLSQERLDIVKNRLSSPEVQFVFMARQLQNSRLPQYRQKFIEVITADVCESPKFRLTPYQYSKCPQIFQQLASTGILSTMSYTQRIVYNHLLSILSTQTSALQMRDIDLMIYYQFRIFQLIQDQIILQNIAIGNTLLWFLMVVYAINGVVLVMVVVGLWWMNVREKKMKMRQLKYLLTIPPSQLKNNKYIRKFAMEYCLR